MASGHRCLVKEATHGLGHLDRCGNSPVAHRQTLVVARGDNFWNRPWSKMVVRSNLRESRKILIRKRQCEKEKE